MKPAILLLYAMSRAVAAEPAPDFSQQVVDVCEEVIHKAPLVRDHHILKGKVYNAIVPADGIDYHIQVHDQDGDKKCDFPDDMIVGVEIAPFSPEYGRRHSSIRRVLSIGPYYDGINVKSSQDISYCLEDRNKVCSRSYNDDWQKNESVRDLRRDVGKIKKRLKAAPRKR